MKLAASSKCIGYLPRIYNYFIQNASDMPAKLPKFSISLVALPNGKYPQSLNWFVSLGGRLALNRFLCNLILVIVKKYKEQLRCVHYDLGL